MLFALDACQAARHAAEQQVVSLTQRMALLQEENRVLKLSMEAASQTASAVELSLVREIRKIDKDELGECHDAMEGFRVMYQNVKGSEA